MEKPHPIMKKGVRIFTKVAIICLVVFGVLAIAIQIIGSTYVTPMIGNQLQKLVREGSDSLYRIQYSKMNVNLWTGTISIHGVKISTDSTYFNRLKRVNELPAVSLALNLEEGRIVRFNLFSFFTKKEVDVARIVTQDAEITLYRHFKTKDKEQQASRVSEPLWKLMRPDIQSLHIGEVAFNNIKLAYYNLDSSSAFQWKFEQFNTRLSDILVDSASAMDTQRLLYMGNIETDVKQISLFSADSMYQMSIENLSYSMKNRLAEVRNFKLQPTLSNKEFYQRTKMEKDIYRFEVGDLKLLHFKPESFLTDNALMADTAILSKVNLNIYHDRVPTDDTASKLGKYPHQMLLKAPFFIRIKKVLGDQVSVTYTERDSKTLKEGTINFTNISGDASHISNHPDDIAQNNKLQVLVKGTFMKKVTLDGRFLFDLTSADGSFEAEAKISPMDVRIMNPVTEALASARFKSLKTGPVYYKIKGNEKAAYGHLEMPYTDLQMEILDYSGPGKDPKNKKIQSWIIKTFSHNHNPGVDGQLRIASNVREERNPKRSFFNLIWKTMFTAGKEIAMKESAKKIYKKKQEKKAAQVSSKSKQTIAKK